ncbi:hypothetical protein TrVE_jg7248 [Triparma verrucosa]|uniref:Uncharacterized protein n=1 Tax=Triparma verrucosa TaxID=1606542 RepID=A0A9W7C2L8_9STRA|nr:hypothetical protein TrVE_jg7248 [Triparma verrucosa]
MVAPLDESLIPNPPPPEPLAFEFGGIRVRLDFRRVRRDLSRGEVTLYLNGTTLSDVRTSATPAIICQVNPALASPFVKEWQVWQVGDVGVGIARVTPEGVDDVVVGEGGEGLLRRSERGVEGMWREWRERRAAEELAKKEAGVSAMDVSMEADNDGEMDFEEEEMPEPDGTRQMRELLLQQSQTIQGLLNELASAREEISSLKTQLLENQAQEAQHTVHHHERIPTSSSVGGGVYSPPKVQTPKSPTTSDYDDYEDDSVVVDKTSQRANYDLTSGVAKAVVDDDIPRIRYASDSDFGDDSGDDEDGGGDDDDFYDSVGKGRGLKGNLLRSSYDFSTTSGFSGLSGASGNSDFSEMNLNRPLVNVIDEPPQTQTQTQTRQKSTEEKPKKKKAKGTAGKKARSKSREGGGGASAQPDPEALRRLGEALARTGTEGGSTTTTASDYKSLFSNLMGKMG